VVVVDLNQQVVVVDLNQQGVVVDLNQQGVVVGIVDKKKRNLSAKNLIILATSYFFMHQTASHMPNMSRNIIPTTKRGRLRRPLQRPNYWTFR